MLRLISLIRQATLLRQARLAKPGVTPAGSGFLEPIGEEFSPTVCPLLGRHGVADVILPLAVDLEESKRHALDPKPQLLHYASARTVAGDDRHFNPVKTESLKCVLQDDDDSFWDQTQPGQVLIDPVAHRPVLERTSLDGRKGDLSRETSLHEESEAKAGTELTFSFTHEATTGKTGSVFRRQRCALGPRFPGDQPRATSVTYLVPGFVILFGQGGKPNPPPWQLEGSNGRGRSTRAQRRAIPGVSDISAIRSGAVAGKNGAAILGPICPFSNNTTGAS